MQGKIIEDEKASSRKELSKRNDTEDPTIATKLIDKAA